MSYVHFPFLLLPRSISLSSPLNTILTNPISQIRQWRERRDLDIAARAKKSAEKKAATISAAQKWTDEFYENYNRKKDRSLAKTRKEADDFLASREDTSAGGTSWDRIAKLVDLSGKGSRGGAPGMGKEKFRELLVNLKSDEKAPGAGGV